MKARVKATGEIVEVEFVNTYRLNDGSFVEVFRDLNTDTLCFGRDLDFDIEGKFDENCLNGIKQNIVHDPDYWARLEHQYAGMEMQVMSENFFKDYRDYCAGFGEMDIDEVKATMKDFADAMADVCYYFAHALVEKYKKEK